MLSYSGIVGAEDITMDFMTEEERIFAQTLDKDILAQFKRHVHAIWRPIRVAQAALDQRVADLEERAAKAMLVSGTMTAGEVAKSLGCAVSTLYRHLPGGRAALDASG